jgi:hypothetical protein
MCMALLAMPKTPCLSFDTSDFFNPSTTLG